MMHEMLDKIRWDYKVPKDIIFALPTEEIYVSRPLRGWVTLYKEMFRSGLRLPLHPFVHKWMDFLGVALH